MRIFVLLASVALCGCAAEPKRFLTSEAQDDKTCQSYMRNKRQSDHTSYGECRQSLVDFANMPASAPAPANVTVIVNR